MSLIRFLSLALLFGVSFLNPAFSQQPQPERITLLEAKVSEIDRDVKNASDTGLVLFLFGAFCALWAQNTGRSAWLWFFLGLFFNVLAILFLLTKNSNDNFEKKQFRRSQ